MNLILLASDVSVLIAQKLAGGTELINKLEKPLLGVLVLVIMFGMGATLNLNDFKVALKKPKGILVGFLSQFGFMPALAFGISWVFQLDPQNAIALILIGCLPAGSTSNMFAYFSRGDLALSISMTSASTLMAIIMTPILLVFYGGLSIGGTESFTTQLGAQMEGGKFVIPVKDIIVSLLVVMVPVIGGMILLKKSPGWAKAAEDTAGFAGILVILFLLASVLARHSDLIVATDWKIILSSILVGLAGFKFGYLFSWLLGLPPRFRRTISLETGIQNGPLAFAIVLLTFGGSTAEKNLLANQMLWLPILYSMFIVITSSVVTLIYRKIGKDDYELYVNEGVQKKLFGPHYRDGMSGPKAAV